jgi:spore coat protein A
VIIDFSHVPVGAKLILYNDAPAPFPEGDPRNDYFTHDSDQTPFGGAPSTPPGFGPNTRTLMQFQVVPRVGPADPSSMNLLEALAVSADGQIGQLVNGLLPKLDLLEVRKAVRVRDLTLNETFDDYGRLIQLLGTNQVQDTSNGQLEFGRAYDSEPTEVVHQGATEVWRIFNLTGDTHPMHFHLVNVQVLSRQPFNVPAYDGVPQFTDKPRLPDPNELGWKETVRMNPGECTTIIARFDLPKVPYSVPTSPRTGGHEYVWHCHILEHEEHDMMRPLVVK